MMNVYRAAATALVLTLASLGAAPARAGESVVTGIAGPDCEILTWVKEDPMGKPLPKAEWHQDLSRCRGPDGWWLYFSDGGDHQAIRFSRRPLSDTQGFLVFPGFGTVVGRIDWRGPAGKPFRPDAAVLRFSWQDSENADRHPMSLAVARLGKDDASTCVFAYVEIVKGRDAYATADRLAGTEAARIDCAKVGEPKLVPAD